MHILLPAPLSVYSLAKVILLGQELYVWFLTARFSDGGSELCLQLPAGFSVCKTEYNKLHQLCCLLFIALNMVQLIKNKGRLYSVCPPEQNNMVSPSDQSTVSHLYRILEWSAFLDHLYPEHFNTPPHPPVHAHIHIHTLTAELQRANQEPPGVPCLA